jgi:hypothetical protein
MKHFQLLRSLLFEKLLHTEIPTEFGEFKKWISSGKYIVRDIPSSKRIDIEINDEYAFCHMMAFDSCRMSAAAFETMHNIQSVALLPKSFGWIAIQSYYAAFFSAHSIIRSFGYVCSQLEKGHITQLNNYAQAVGLSNSIKPEAGFFSGSFNSNSRILFLSKMKNTHEDTWSTLIECLNEISQNVLNVTGLSAHKQQVSASISDLIDRLTSRGKFAKGNFLSQFRNSVNYRHEHDSWHPYGKHSIKSEKIVSLLANWKSENDLSMPIWKESLEVYNFFVACREVINFNYLLIQLIIESSEKHKNLYTRWPAKLLNIISVA